MTEGAINQCNGGVSLGIQTLVGFLPVEGEVLIEEAEAHRGDSNHRCAKQDDCENGLESEPAGRGHFSG